MNAPTRLALAIILSALSLSLAQAHEPVMTIPDPGYRPESELASEFSEEIDSAIIAVYPTIVRRIERTAHSLASQAQVVEFLNEQGIGRVIAARHRIDRGRLGPQSQWSVFESGLLAIAEALPGTQVEADYNMVLEILVPGDEAVFGIECYIVDREGENAFSFLLNAHHQMFAAAGLSAGESQAAREKMISEATAVAMRALTEQLAVMRQCAAGANHTPMQLPSDFIDDFESGLVSGSVTDEVRLGFSTFHGERSRATISTTTEHPPIRGRAPGNSVLRLQLEVETWAGVLRRFTAASAPGKALGKARDGCKSGPAGCAAAPGPDHFS